MTKPGYWFRSPLFEIEPGEGDEVNPGRYGRQLANWLKRKLEDSGYQVEPVIHEDWGRCLVCSRRPCLLWVGVANVDGCASAEPPTAETIVWHCFPVAEVAFLKRLFAKVDTSVAVEQLDATLKSILAAEDKIQLVSEP